MLDVTVDDEKLSSIDLVLCESPGRKIIVDVFFFFTETKGKKGLKASNLANT